MAIQIQLRRGTSTQHAAFTGVLGEATINTTNNSLHIHDGTAVGGFELARKDFSNVVSGAIANSKLANSTISGISLGSNLPALTIGTGLTGSSYNGSTAVTIALANTAVTAGSYGSSTAVPVITVDAQGRITSASSAAISGAITISGDATGTGTTGGTTAVTLATVNANVGAFGSSTQIPTITVNAKGLVTAVSTTAVLIPSGAISVTGGDLTLSGTTGTAITNATLAASGVTAGTYTKITVDAKGRATLGASATTTDISEGTNLYYTQSRFDTALSLKSTTNLTEGTNLYYTQARFDTAFAAKSTTNLAEGTNLYYTDVRARASNSAGTGISYNTTTGAISTVQDISSTASPTFAALTTTGAGTIGGNLIVSGNLTVNGTTTTINATTVSVADINIELGKTGTPSNATADGGGITLKGTTDKTFNWVNATSAWTSSEHLALAAGKTAVFYGATSGTITLSPTAAAGTTTLTLPATTGTLITSGDTGTVTNTMLAGSIATSKITGLAASATTDTTNASNISSGTLPNARLVSVPNSSLANSSLTIGTTAIALGAASTVLAGLTSVTSTSFVGALTGNTAGTHTGAVVGNADTASKWATARVLSLTGDVTGSMTVDGSAAASAAVTLAASGVTAGSYTSANITVDAKGRVTAASSGTGGGLATTGGTLTGNLLYSGNTKSIYGPNTSWGAYLHIGGDGVNGITRTDTLASIVTTNGNMHLDAGSTRGIYLNWYSGTDGVWFGNGASGQIGRLTNAGNLTVTGTVLAAAHQVSSDVRLKTNIENSTYGLHEVLALRSVKYIKNDKEEIGLIAQEVEKTLPEFVGEDEDSGMKSVNYAQMVSVLIKAVQELNAEVVSLKAQLGK